MHTMFKWSVNPPHVDCCTFSEMRGVIGPTALRLKVCASPTAIKLSPLSTIFSLRRMPQYSCTPFYPDVHIINRYLDLTKKLWCKIIQFYPLSKPTSKIATETNEFHNLYLLTKFGPTTASVAKRPSSLVVTVPAPNLGCFPNSLKTSEVDRHDGGNMKHIAILPKSNTRHIINPKHTCTSWQEKYLPQIP